MRRLGLTLLLVLLPLIAASLLLGGYLNYASVRNTYLEMVGHRMETVARRIASDAQMALSMGLPLAGQDALERALVRESEADPDLASVDVVSSTGRILFSSDESRRGIDDAPDRAIAERRTVPIISAFETAEGTVVVRARRSAIDAALTRLEGTIGVAVGLALAIAALAVALVVLLAVRILYRRLTERGETSAGRAVPAEMLAVVDEVDEAHRAIAARLAATGAERTSAHASL
ncbi:hypothetical protein L1787_19940 [Acuticoccus sp. M5D2P5]|uniref:hypothetical protein n=1 Tax=Acuticoccus kalidii TaxID=2910977 RepID=UPI001F34A35A|nr:hypothetical protein [Acuticoccus kalidii]MCF3935669.1 hypothetical protein [Acuticoccus kalidii]